MSGLGVDELAVDELAVDRRRPHRTVRVGQLAFGVAFVVVGLAWFLREAGLRVESGWPAIAAVLVAGIAGLTLVVRSTRRSR